MIVIKIKNCQVSSDIYCGVTINAEEYYTIQNESELELLSHNDKVNQHLWSTPAKILINDGENDLSPAEGSAWLSGNHIEAKIIEQPEPHPFAAPDYRTKNNATTSIETCALNDTADIDFQLTTERYVSGGEITVKNPEFGDYMTACVYDGDEVIPEAYREALCEDWPCVAEYVEKEWIPMGNVATKGDDFFVSHTLDARPLQAKISAGLYLRITYHAVNSGGDREIAVNYNLTKKL